MEQQPPCRRRSISGLTGLPALAGVAIYDAVPPSPAGTFVLVGPEEVRDASDKSGAGAEHRLAGQRDQRWHGVSDRQDDRGGDFR